jgi:hypothetical protein
MHVCRLGVQGFESSVKKEFQKEELVNNVNSKTIVYSTL